MVLRSKKEDNMDDPFTYNGGLGAVTTKRGKAIGNNKITGFESTDNPVFGQNPNAIQQLRSGFGVNPVSTDTMVSQIAQKSAPLTSNSWANGAIDLSQNQNQDLYATGNAMENELLGKTPKTDVAGQPISYFGDTWKNAVQGAKDMFGVTPSQSLHDQYLASAGKDFVPAEYDKGIMIKPASGLSEADWTTQQQKQQMADNNTFGTYAGAGMGAISTGLGVLNYFDQKAMNKKNSQLIDQQIANNQDIMGTRRARAADIQKYFG